MLGLTAAMALAKFSPESAPPKIRVFEIRPKPGVIGVLNKQCPSSLPFYLADIKTGRCQSDSKCSEAARPSGRVTDHAREQLRNGN